MSTKKKSVITKVTLNTPTYKNETIDNLSFVNFFYGNNGTGKTTLANELIKPANLEIKAGLDLSNYNIFSYNSDFIKNNFSLKDKVKAIYTLGQINVANQQRISDIKKEIKDNKKSIEGEEKAAETAKQNKEVTITSSQNLFWSNSKTQREFFSQYMQGFLKNKAAFLTRVIETYDNKETIPLIDDYDKLCKTIETAFNADETDYPPFIFPEVKIPNKDDLLATSLTSSDSTEFARFVKILNNTSWLKEGHDKYHNSDGKCPYCQQPLPDNFEEDYKSCFDEDYQKSIDDLTLFHKDYQYQFDALISGLRDNLKGAMPTLKLDDYRVAIDNLEKTYKYNLKLIEDKLNKPDTKITLNDTSNQLNILKGMVFVNNQIIKEHKEILKNKRSVKLQCEKDTFRFLAHHLENEILSFKDSIKSIDDSIKEHSDKILELKNSNISLNNEAASLGANAVSAEPVVKAINKTIENSGFQGFHLEWDENDKGSYQVVYNSKDSTGKYIPATKLSEGETNFIAFLYFYFMAVNTDESGSDKNSIVVIDDPVSSMDSQTLFIVSSLVKNLIDRCINSSTIDENSPITDNNVEQIFILTHNVYFHANITPEYENNYSAVNFYQITKVGNHSKVKLRTKIGADGNEMNVNPIKNSYAALWRELEEVETSISACNIIHRILGYYFLNLCGYTNKKLEEELLVNNADKFLKDENGNETQDRYNLVRSFLEYLGHSQDVVGNEVYYVDAVDVQTCRDTLKLVFDAMKQSQHYDMMINQK